MNYLTEIALYINIVLIVYMFCEKNLFFYALCEKKVKSGDALGGMKKLQKLQKQ